jgi:hypothetical protein
MMLVPFQSDLPQNLRLSELDTQMNSILRRNDLKENQKLQLYNQTLSRFLMLSKYNKSNDFKEIQDQKQFHQQDQESKQLNNAFQNEEFKDKLQYRTKPNTFNTVAESSNSLSDEYDSDNNATHTYTGQNGPGKQTNILEQVNYLNDINEENNKNKKFKKSQSQFQLNTIDGLNNAWTKY